MSEPTAVTIVRPHRKTSDLVGELVGRVGGIFLTAWLVMLTLPAATHWNPGYGQTLAGVLVIGFLKHPPTSLDSWTRRARKGER